MKVQHDYRLIIIILLYKLYKLLYNGLLKYFL